MELPDYLSTDPDICGGQICIKGTRIMAFVILDNLAEDQSIEEILENYPTLTREGILAAIKYAALLAKDVVISV